jgi:putative pyruvate formate lyase activating enzyme
MIFLFSMDYSFLILIIMKYINRNMGSYLSLLSCGILDARSIEALRHLEACDVCPRKCKINRLAGKVGSCRVGKRVRVSSYGPHFGEESPLSGWKGSGTIFFTRCNLNCVFCQNADISQTDLGNEIEPEQLASIMLDLQTCGCHNINLVSPSHVVPHILCALVIAAREGLHIPLVYNTGGFDSLEMLQLMDGVIDIYMPDMKYSDPQIARRFSGIPNYPKVNQAAVREMHQQVGDLQLDSNGLAVKGLLVRHLVLPNGMAGSTGVLQFLAGEVSKNTYLNIMDQYHPAYRARTIPELKRRISNKEYIEVVQLAQQLGMHRLNLKAAF